MQENTKSMQLTREFANSHELDGLLPREGERSSERESNFNFLPIHVDLFSGFSVKHILVHRFCN